MSSLMAMGVGLCTGPIVQLFRQLRTGSVRYGYGIIAPYTNRNNTGIIVPDRTVPYLVVTPRVR